MEVGVVVADATVAVRSPPPATASPAAVMPSGSAGEKHTSSGGVTAT